MRLMGLMGLMGILALCGCTTVSTTAPDGSTNIVSVPDVRQLRVVAKSAAYLGTVIWLEGLGDQTRVPAHPQDRDKFEMARDALKVLIAGGTFSGEDLKAALQTLPVKELQGGNGSLVVGEAVILWDQYGRQLVGLDKAQVFATYLLPVAQAIEEGLSLGLGTGPDGNSP